MYTFQNHAASIFTMKMEAAWSSETVVCYHITAGYYNPGKYDLNVHRHENKCGI
jgi:hypothetical protein